MRRNEKCTKCKLPRPIDPDDDLCHECRTAIETRERAKAVRVMEKYFDTDITEAISAYDVLVDNGVDARVANMIANEMFPEEETT